MSVNEWLDDKESQENSIESKAFEAEVSRQVFLSQRPSPGEALGEVHIIADTSVAKKRRVASWRERATPCVCCGYPISERHHILDVARYGESNLTVQLCARCHEIYHMIDRNTPESRGLIGRVIRERRDDWPFIDWLRELHAVAQGIEFEASEIVRIAIEKQEGSKK